MDIHSKKVAEVTKFHLADDVGMGRKKRESSESKLKKNKKREKIAQKLDLGDDEGEFDDEAQYEAGSGFPEHLMERPDFKEFLRTFDRGFESEDFIRKCRDILKKKERTEWDLKLLLKFCEQVKFFDKFSSEYEKKVQLCRGLQYKTVQGREYVFKKGDTGTSLFIVFGGSVEVYLSETSKPAATLGRGESFGELALATTSIRPSTVITREATELLVLDRKDYDRILRSDSRIEEQAEFINSMMPFRQWSRTRVVDLCAYLRSQTYRRGDVIIEEGSIADAVYFLKRGDAKVEMYLDFTMTSRIPTETGQFTVVEKRIRKQVEVNRLRQGSYFGEEACLKGLRRGARVTALTSCEILILPRTQFGKLVSEDTATLELFEKGFSSYVGRASLQDTHIYKTRWTKFKKELLKDVGAMNPRGYQSQLRAKTPEKYKKIAPKDRLSMKNLNSKVDVTVTLTKVPYAKRKNHSGEEGVDSSDELPPRSKSTLPRIEGHHRARQSPSPGGRRGPESAFDKFNRMARERCPWPNRIIKQGDDSYRRYGNRATNPRLQQQRAEMEAAAEAERLRLEEEEAGLHEPVDSNYYDSFRPGRLSNGSYGSGGSGSRIGSVASPAPSPVPQAGHGPPRGSQASNLSKNSAMRSSLSPIQERAVPERPVSMPG
eukprot:GFYU01015416.1.p1 GENE.GFYU01015416.1~~GFYU01015416.1.p1  ORF type:complete len:659 (-),score=127.64 GFYU01015416.1:278-2254(-)